jgi:hypothetical protein
VLPFNSAPDAFQLRPDDRRSLLAAAGGRALSIGCLGGGTEGTTETGATSGGYVAMEEDEDEERGAAEVAEVPS